MDDLTRIKGIGPKTAEELREAGITSFAQIAEYAALPASAPMPAPFDDTMPASRLDEWGPQAAALAAETVSEAPAEANSAVPEASAGDGPAAAAREAGEAPASANTQQGSSGTTREAPSTGGGTSDEAAASPNVGVEPGSPTHIRIAARRDGFRRAGMRHSKAPVEHPIGRFDEQQLAALLAEPNLVVELVTLDTRGREAGGAA